MAKRAEQTHKAIIDFDNGEVATHFASSEELADKAGKAKVAWAKRYGSIAKYRVEKI